MNCLTVGQLKIFLNAFDDDDEVMVVTNHEGCYVEDLEFMACASESCHGVYLYGDSMKEDLFS